MTNEKDIALVKAAKNRKWDDVRRLADDGANVNTTSKLNETATYHAAEFDAPEIIKLLLDKGADPNISSGDETPLAAAARYCYSKSVIALLDGGANFNCKNKQGQTALDLAKSQMKCTKDIYKKSECEKTIAALQAAERGIKTK